MTALDLTAYNGDGWPSWSAVPIVIGALALVCALWAGAIRLEHWLDDRSHNVVRETDETGRPIVIFTCTDCGGSFHIEARAYEGPTCGGCIWERAGEQLRAER